MKIEEAARALMRAWKKGSKGALRIEGSDAVDVVTVAVSMLHEEGHKEDARSLQQQLSKVEGADLKWPARSK